MAGPASSSCGHASCTPYDTATTARKVRENPKSIVIATKRNTALNISAVAIARPE